MKKCIPTMQLVMVAHVLFGVQSISAHQTNLRTKESLDEEKSAIEDLMYQDRDLDIQYKIDGNTTTIYYNETYSRTYFNGDHEYTSIDDYHFKYDHRYEYYNEEYEGIYGNNEDGDEQEEDDVPDEGSFMGKIFSLQSSLDTLFSSSPLKWSGGQWGLFFATFGSIFVLVISIAFCCLHSARGCGDTYDKYAGDEETMLEDTSECEEAASDDDDMVYVKLSSSGK